MCIRDSYISELKDLYNIRILKCGYDKAYAREFEVVGNKPLYAFKCPQEDALGFGFHLLRKVRIISSIHRLSLIHILA